jgi:hypothetical protein
MGIDLAKLREMHTKLPADLAELMVARAALALERNGHVSGVSVSIDIDRVLVGCHLSWQPADMSKIDQHDQNRITEDGAEGVSLALAHRHRGWSVIRRLQRGEGADWLLEDSMAGRRSLVALEVSGVDRGRIAPRLTEKLAQVAASCDVDQRWASVVGFEAPVAALYSTEKQHHGD